MASLDELASQARTSIARIASKVSTLKDEHLGPMFDLTKQLGKAIAEIESPVKERVKKLLVSSGSEFTDAGSKELHVGGWRLEVRPSGGGWDGAKLASLMKSLGIKRIKYMDVEKVYKLSSDKLDALVKSGVVSKKDLDKCKNEPGWAVQTPTKDVADE